MKKVFLLLLWVSVFGFSQSKPLEINLLPIKHFDSTSTERVFLIEYTIKNISDNDIAFFLHEDRFFPTHSSALQPITSYAIYQNNKALEVSSIFTTNRKYFNSQQKYEIYKKYIDSIKNKITEESLNDPDYFIKKSSAELIKSIKVLKPNEVLQQSQLLYWDKKRYYKIQDLEYYLSESDTYTFQLNFVALKEEYKNKLTNNDFLKINENKNFIKGWFTSNKVEINFKE